MGTGEREGAGTGREEERRRRGEEVERWHQGRRDELEMFRGEEKLREEEWRREEELREEERRRREEESRRKSPREELTLSVSKLERQVSNKRWVLTLQRAVCMGNCPLAEVR